MCGRYVVDANQEDLLAHFGLGGQLAGLHPMPPRYNIAPTQPILTIVGSAEHRQAQLMRWAFLPDWVKDPSSFSLLTNARAESAATKPSFRNALRYRRCIIPASGFYEWNRNGSIKQPYYMSARSGGLLAMAGIWETWMGPNGEEQDGAAILTIESNDAMSKIHHRMPVILDKADYGTWLECKSGYVDQIKPLLRPLKEDFLTIIPVSQDVNRTSNDHSDLIRDITPSMEQVGEKAKVAPSKTARSKEKGDCGQLDLF
jgi:putative SOS response-associated peptidase YedK